MASSPLCPHLLQEYFKRVGDICEAYKPQIVKFVQFEEVSPLLVSRRILTNEERDKLSSLDPNEAQMSKVLDILLRRMWGLENLITILIEVNLDSWLVEEMFQKYVHHVVNAIRKLQSEKQCKCFEHERRSLFRKALIKFFEACDGWLFTIGTSLGCLSMTFYPTNNSLEVINKMLPLPRSNEEVIVLPQIESVEPFDFCYDSDHGVQITEVQTDTLESSSCGSEPCLDKVLMSHSKAAPTKGLSSSRRHTSSPGSKTGPPISPKSPISRLSSSRDKSNAMRSNRGSQHAKLTLGHPKDTSTIAVRRNRHVSKVINPSTKKSLETTEVLNIQKEEASIPTNSLHAPPTAIQNIIPLPGREDYSRESPESPVNSGNSEAMHPQYFNTNNDIFRSDDSLLERSAGMENSASEALIESSVETPKPALPLPHSLLYSSTISSKSASTEDDLLTLDMTTSEDLSLNLAGDDSSISEEQLNIFTMCYDISGSNSRKQSSSDEFFTVHSATNSFGGSYEDNDTLFSPLNSSDRIFWSNEDDSSDSINNFPEAFNKGDFGSRPKSTGSGSDSTQAGEFSEGHKEYGVLLSPKEQDAQAYDGASTVISKEFMGENPISAASNEDLLAQTMLKDAESTSSQYVHESDIIPAISVPPEQSAVSMLGDSHEIPGGTSARNFSPTTRNEVLNEKYGATYMDPRLSQDAPLMTEEATLELLELIEKSSAGVKESFRKAKTGNIYSHLTLQGILVDDPILENTEIFTEGNANKHAVKVQPPVSTAEDEKLPMPQVSQQKVITGSESKEEKQRLPSVRATKSLKSPISTTSQPENSTKATKGNLPKATPADPPLKPGINAKRHASRAVGKAVGISNTAAPRTGRNPGAVKQPESKSSETIKNVQKNASPNKVIQRKAPTPSAKNVTKNVSVPIKKGVISKEKKVNSPGNFGSTSASPQLLTSKVEKVTRVVKRKSLPDLTAVSTNPASRLGRSPLKRVDLKTFEETLSTLHLDPKAVEEASSTSGKIERSTSSCPNLNSNFLVPSSLGCSTTKGKSFAAAGASIQKSTETREGSTSPSTPSSPKSEGKPLTSSSRVVNNRGSPILKKSVLSSVPTSPGKTTKVTTISGKSSTPSNGSAGTNNNVGNTAANGSVTIVSLGKNNKAKTTGTTSPKPAWSNKKGSPLSAPPIIPERFSPFSVQDYNFQLWTNEWVAKQEKKKAEGVQSSNK